MDMKKPAPHLPPKSCRIDTYYRLQNIRWILLFALLAFLAGICAAIITGVWILPQNDTGNIWVDSNLDNQVISYNKPDPFFVKQSEQRFFTIYDKRKKTAEKIYSEESFVSQAVVISSDGWAAAYVPDYFLGWEKNWEIIDYQNNVFSVDKVVLDSFSQVLYFKIEMQGSRVVSFPTWDRLKIGSFVWTISEGKWQENYIKENNKIKTDKSFYIWNEQYYYSLADSVLPGSLLIDEQGNFVGFVDDGGLIVAGWLVEKQINNLLSNGILSYNNFNWKGHMVKIAKDNGVNISGFYLDSVGTKASTTTLGMGDVILKIDGKNIEANNIAENAWLSPNEFEVVLWRNGQEISILVTKQKINL